MLNTPRTIREQITDRIRSELVSGDFPAGSTLREAELAKRLGVSRGPVRDAFIQLSNEGYLAYQANRGVTVRQPPNPQDRAFVTSLRLQIETYVIEKKLATVDDAGVEQVEAAMKEMDLACQQGEAADIARCDINFHESLLKACGADDLIAAWRLLCSRMLLTYTRHKSYEQITEEHVRILNAFKEKDASGVVKALSANIR